MERGGQWSVEASHFSLLQALLSPPQSLGKKKKKVKGAGDVSSSRRNTPSIPVCEFSAVFVLLFEFICVPVNAFN